MSNFFARSSATDARLLKRSCESLIGICTGMLVDGVLSDEEIIFLKNWLDENSEIAYCWPGELIYKRVNDILVDGEISDKERTHLAEMLQQLTGSNFQGTGAVDGEATKLPVEQVELKDIAGKTFCFTGTFLFGTRNACHKATKKVGGVPAPRITKKLDYLVIGTMSTRSWAHSSFGRKIEKAVEIQQAGCPLVIIDEQCWARILPESR